MGEYDCLRCGACCTSKTVPDGAAQLTLAEATDYFFTNDAVKPAIEFRNDHAVFKMMDRPDGCKECWFFAGTVGVSSRCTIHAARPQSCRDYEPGSHACKQARIAFGLNPDGDPCQASMTSESSGS